MIKLTDLRQRGAEEDRTATRMALEITRLPQREREREKGGVEVKMEKKCRPSTERKEIYGFGEDFIMQSATTAQAQIPRWSSTWLSYNDSVPLPRFSAQVIVKETFTMNFFFFLLSLNGFRFIIINF